jgi:hypothetical protein
MSTLTEEQALELIKTKKERQKGYCTDETCYYAEVFRKNKDNKWVMSWNWAAFLASIYAPLCWMNHRRMYLYVLLLVINFALLMFLGSLFLDKVLLFFSSILLLLSPLLLGMFGNALYFHHIRRKIAQRISYAGTNSPIMWLAYGIYVVSCCTPIILSFVD